MHSSRRAAAGFGLVALGQLCYLSGGLSVSFGTLVDVASVAAAAVCAVALWLVGVDSPDAARRTVAIALTVFAAFQLVEYLQGFGGVGSVDPFFVGFTLVIVGLVLAAIGALQWRAWMLRWGPLVAAVGTFSYVAIGLARGFGLGPGVFTLGAILAGAGWAIVGLA